MKMKVSYVIIPLVTIATASLGSSLTSIGLAGWYGSLRLPSWTPPGGVIGAVWTTIFALATISALLVWNKADAARKKILAAAFLTNAALNVLWSWIFFVRHQTLAAAWEALLLEASVLVLIVVTRPLSRLAAALLVPYTAWVVFACYLTFTVARLNP